MSNDTSPEKYAVLQQDDEKVLEALQAILTERIAGDPYSPDGSFAHQLASLPLGLRAMAATHWLDISLTLDSITWHFGNFGERGLVAATEAGLIELGLTDLAVCFREAREVVLPLLAERTDEDKDLYDYYALKGCASIIEHLDNKAWGLKDTSDGESAIYDAWVRYARQHPERIFTN